MSFRRRGNLVLEKGDGSFEGLWKIRAASEIIIDDCLLEFTVPTGVCLPEKQACEVFPLASFMTFV